MLKRYIKIAVPVQVQFPSSSGTVHTLEGLVHYETGDAILSGTNNDVWPVTRSIFDQTYSAVPPTIHGQPGTYIKVPIQVFAYQLAEPALITLANNQGVIKGLPGDWVIKNKDGHQWIVTHDIFEKTYREIV